LNQVTITATSPLECLRNRRPILSSEFFIPEVPSVDRLVKLVMHLP